MTEDDMTDTPHNLIHHIFIVVVKPRKSPLLFDTLWTYTYVIADMDYMIECICDRCMCFSYQG